MGDFNRRTVLLGAGMVAAVASTPLVTAGRAHADPDATPQDLALLRQTFRLAEDARRRGGAPYGALVADAAGNAVAQHGNTSQIDGGDPTDHAETMTLRDAWRVLGDDGMKQATLYASTEPCTMCAGAAYWCGIGRVVYGMSNTRLFAFTGDDPAHASFALPCRQILQNGWRPVAVLGPLLEEEAAHAHQGYWR